MSWSLDARIPIRLLAPADLAAAISAASAPVALLLPEASAPAQGQAAAVACFKPGGSGHVVGCACCAARPPAGVALDQLFQARTRGTCAWFGSVLAVVPDAAARQAVESALKHDPLTAARFRLG